METKERACAHTLGLSRRRLLAAAPALALAGAIPAAAEADTPISALFREWATIHNVANLGQATDAEIEAASDRMLELDREMMHLPSLNATDLLMKIAAFTAWGDFDISDCSYAKADIIWNEMRALTGVQA